MGKQSQPVNGVPDRERLLRGARVDADAIGARTQPDAELAVNDDAATTVDEHGAIKAPRRPAGDDWSNAAPRDLAADRHRPVSRGGTGRDRDQNRREQRDSRHAELPVGRELTIDLRSLVCRRPATTMSQHRAYCSTLTRYQQIGKTYSATRREDPAHARRIALALGSARTVVNVGAGAGSYEPRDRHVIAIEPSDVMAAQRPPELPPAISASAGALPLRDRSVDAAMAILTIHHWDEEQERGVRELRRVARGPVVIVTYVYEVSNDMWLMKDYLPEVAEMDRRILPSTERIARWLGGSTEVETLEISRDTPDWTIGSFWAHPERVLDPRARAGTSGFARMTPEVVERVVSSVQRDLESGVWDERYGHLRRRQSFDAGLRLITNTPGRVSEGSV